MAKGIPHDATLSIRKVTDEERVKIRDWTWPQAKAEDALSLHDPSWEERTIQWGLSEHQNKAIASDGTCIDIVHLQQGQTSWHPNVKDEDIETYMRRAESQTGEKSVRLCFVNTLPELASNLACNFSIRPATINALRAAGLSSYVLSDMFTESSCWTKMGNRKSFIRETSGKFEALELCYQYRAGWKTDGHISYIHSRHDQHGVTYFCVNYPSEAFVVLKSMLATDFDTWIVRLQIDILAVQASLAQWQHNVGIRRIQIIKKEKLYEGAISFLDFGPETQQLHALLKDILSLREELVAFKTQLEYLRDAFVMLLEMDYISAKCFSTDGLAATDTTNPFDALISQTELLARRPIAYRQRVEICIQLLYHFQNQSIAESSRTIAEQTQRDSASMLDIAESSRKIAEQTQRDSASMITIAAVTMVFLPGTFISAILSTTIFDFGQEALQVSSKWWVLVATTIPLTIGVFGFWFWWKTKGFPRQHS